MEQLNRERILSLEQQAKLEETQKNFESKCN